MPNFTNYLEDSQRDLTPSFKEITISTKRRPAIASGKVGALVANLSGVKTSPKILPSAQSQHAIRQAIGLEGSAVQVWELYTKSHTHTDSGVSVTQLPDIKTQDVVTIDNEDYIVRWAEYGHRHSFGEVLIIYITEDKRA